MFRFFQAAKIPLSGVASKSGLLTGDPSLLDEFRRLSSFTATLRVIPVGRVLGKCMLDELERFFCAL